ncbi:MAG TPA: hypothetical protein VGJ30_13050 [Candidatus Angelobacter sp.]|jgi:hypothetical protein
MFDAIGTLYILGVVIAAAVSGWIVTMQVRRRMKKSLGRKATDLELASLKTWMKVEEREEQEKESGPIHPR